MKNRRGYKVFLVSFLFLIGTGCSKEIIRTEEFERVKRIDLFIETLVRSYKERDSTTFFSLLLPTFPRSAELKEGLIQNFRLFPEIDLNVELDQVVIEGEELSALLRWEGVWRDPGRALFLTERGHTLFRLVESGGIRLARIDGDNPFLPPRTAQGGR